MRKRGTFARALTACFRREEGFALVLALGIVTVLGMVGTTVMVYSSHNSSLASRSSVDEKAFSLAEAGVNDAMAILQNPSNNALTASLLCSGASLPCDLAHALTAGYDNGVVKYWGNLDPSTSTWTINSWGYMHNPTGPGASDVVRKITTTLKVRPSFMQPPNTQAWNYIISEATGTPGGCDMSLDNSVNMQSPLYVIGNLCLQTPSQITQGTDRNILVVRGHTTLAVNTNIGASGSPIAEAHVAGGCSYKGASFHSPCGSADETWASLSDANPPTLTVPTASYSYWYTNAAPGPTQGCSTASGTVPVFETPGNTAIDSSVPGVFNLTPSGSDYSCIVTNAAGKVVGQISWDHTARKLTVYGTIFIDGSACVCYGFATPISYDGQASLYLSGTFQVSNTIFCGKISGSTCAAQDPPSGWDPNAEMLMVVANGQGGQNPANDSAQIKSSYWQGGLFTTYAIEMDTTSSVEGPMIASTEIIGQTLTAHSWTSITSIPAGAPGTPVVYAQPDPPGVFRG